MQVSTVRLPSNAVADAASVAAKQETEFKTLFKHLSHYLGGRVGIMALGFVSFPVFTRLFSIEQYGTISLVLTAVAVGTAFSKLGLQYSANRYYDEHVLKGDTHSAARFHSTLYLGTVLVAIGAALVFVVAVELVPASVISPDLKPLLGFGAGLVMVRGVQSIVLSLFQVERRTGAYNAVDLAAKIVSVPSILLLALLWRTDVLAFLWGTLFGEGLVVLAATFVLQRYRKVQISRLSWGLLKELMKFGAPLAACELAKIALDFSDRFLVQFYLGAKAVGYYAATYNIASYLQNALVVPLGLALQPIYMRLWTTQGETATINFLSKLMKNYVLLAGAVICTVTVCSADAITMLASSKYREAHRLLPLVITGLMIYGIHLFLNAGLFIHNRTGMVAVLVTLSCVLRIALNCALLPAIGVQGAAIATLVSYLGFVAGMAWVSNRYLPLRMPYVAGLKTVACGAAVLGLVRFDVGGPFVNCLTRGAAAVLVYGSLMCVLEREIGQTILAGVRRLRCGGVIATLPLSSQRNRRWPQ